LQKRVFVTNKAFERRRRERPASAAEDNEKYRKKTGTSSGGQAGLILLNSMGKSAGALVPPVLGLPRLMRNRFLVRTAIDKPVS